MTLAKLTADLILRFNDLFSIFLLSRFFKTTLLFGNPFLPWFLLLLHIYWSLLSTRSHILGSGETVV